MIGQTINHGPKFSVVHALIPTVGTHADRWKRISWIIALSAGLLVLLTSPFVEPGLAISTSQQSVPNNLFTARNLIAPTNLIASPSGHDVSLSWTAGQNGNGYDVRGVANGLNSDCSSAVFGSIGSTSGTSYTDSGRYTPQGNWFCYQSATTLSSWSSTQNNPIAAAQIGFVANSVQLINNGDHSGCSGSGGEMYGQAGYLDCGDQLVINFNQAVNTSTGPTSSDTVCASNTLLLGSTVPSGDCATELIVSGSYTGNGVNGRAITGIGFQPDVVLVKDTVGDGSAIRTSSMVGDSTKFINGAMTAGVIESLDVDGFTVGTNARANTSGNTYHWVAFKQAPGEMKVGSYTGNGVDSRSITGVGFQPDYVIVMPGSSTRSAHRSSAMVGDTTTFFTNVASSTNVIQALQADGFQVGTNASVNTNGTTYYYVAWKATAGKMGVGTYAGNGSDNRNITGVGFQPEWVLVKDATADYAVHKPASTGASTDSSLYFNAVAAAIDHIQQLLADGFQVGTSGEVNANGTAYYWSAFARIPAEPLDLGTLSGGTIGGGNSRFNAGYTWSNGNKTLTVTIGTRVTGSSYPSISAATWTFYPTGTGAKLQSASGGFHICDNNNGGGNCLPSTVGGSMFAPKYINAPTAPHPTATPIIKTRTATAAASRSPSRTPTFPSQSRGTRTATPTPQPSNTRAASPTPEATPTATSTSTLPPPTATPSSMPTEWPTPIEPVGPTTTVPASTPTPTCTPSSSLAPPPGSSPETAPLNCS